MLARWTKNSMWQEGRTMSFTEEVEGEVSLPGQAVLSLLTVQERLLRLTLAQQAAARCFNEALKK